MDFYTDLIWSGITKKAKEQDINTLAFIGRGVTQEVEEKTTSNIIYRFANQHNVDGLIILSAGIGTHISHQELNTFCRQFLPLPIISVGERIEGSVNLLTDNQQGMRDLLKHLIDDHGCQRIAFIQGPTENPEALERLQTYQQVLADKDIPLNPDLIVEGGHTYQHGKMAATELLQRGGEFDALVSFNDVIAWGAIDTLQAHGCYIPGDIAVTGFDDIAGSQYTLPPLTTIRQPLEKLGEQAFELLLARMCEEEVVSEITIGTEMVIRQSCGCLPPVVKLIQSNQVPHLDECEDRSTFQKGSFQKDCLQALDPIFPASDSWQGAWVSELLSACFDETVTGESSAFLEAWNIVLQRSAMHHQSLDFWHEVLSELRCQVSPYLQTADQIKQAENLWQRARIFLSDILQQAQVRSKLQANLHTRLLFEINEEVITTFDLPKLMEALSNALQQLAISFCFLCLNEAETVGLEELPAESRLILAFQDGEQRQLESGDICFPTELLLPDKIWEHQPRWDALILSLRFRNHYLGHAIFEMGERDGFVYDALQIQISNAIQGAFLINQLQQAQTDLESRVEERTAELKSEIAERGRIEKNLRENEERYRALFMQTTDAVYLYDIDTKFLLVNQKAAEILGYTTFEMLWLANEDVLAPDELEDEADKFKLALQGKSVPLYERNLVHKDGHLIPVEINLSLVTDDDGNPLHFQSIVRDITDRKRAERVMEALNLASLAMRQAITPKEIFEAVGNELKAHGFHCTIFRTKHDLSCMFPQYYSFESKAIAAAEKLLNTQAEDYPVSIENNKVFQKTIWDQETILVDDANEAISQLFSDPIKGIETQILGLLNVRRSINAPLIVDQQMMGLFSIQSDDLTADDIPQVTFFAHQIAATWQKARLMQDLELSLVAQLQIEESLRESEEKYRTLFDLSPEAVVVIGLDGIVLDANKAATDFGDLSKKDIIGRSFLDLGLFDKSRAQYFLDLFSLAIIGDITEPIEFQLKFDKNTLHWIEAHPALLRDGDDVIALQLIMRDITDRREAEQAIQQRVDELELIHQTSLKLATASLSVKEVAEIAVQQLSSLMVADQCAFSIIDLPNRKFTVVAETSNEREEKRLLCQGDIISFNDYPVIKRALHTTIPLSITATDPTNTPAEIAYMQANEIQTLVVIPFSVKNRMIGLMELGIVDERYYSLGQLNLAITLANQIAVALDNARLFESAQQEIFDRIQAEIALQASEEQFRSIFENAVMGFYRSTPGGKIIMANPALIRMLGYESFDELAKRNLEENGFEEGAPRSEFIRRMHQDGQVIGFEAIWLRKDNTPLYVQESAKVIYDNNGKIAFYEGTVEDITDKQRAEQERQALIEFQQLVATLSARFINISTSEIEEEITYALKIIAEYARADAGSVWMFSEDKTRGSEAFGWPTLDKRPGNQDIWLSNYTWMFEQLLEGKVISIQSKADFQFDAGPQIFTDIELAAILAIPLITEGDVIGALIIYMRESEKRWSDELESLLKIIGDIIVNALERKRAEESIRQLNEELELRVIQRTQQLEAANTELEAFAYSVSHDLRAPLRAIDGFSLALLEDYSDQLNDDAQYYFERVRQASQRMGQLIDDLLKLSRVTRSEMIHDHVNLSILVTKIFNEFQETAQDRDVEISIQAGLVTLGDEHLLYIMLTNLCENAWKFTQKKEHAQIEFGCLNDNDSKIFFIRDNGAGFDMTYHDKLFGTFQRLHNFQDFEGTGIGLATVKRIIQRHGGRIWAEGKVNEGATFYFTIGEIP